MKRHSLLAISIFTIVTVFIGSTSTMYSSSIIEKIKPTMEEIPEGYMFGQVPGFAQSLLKTNPWNLDQAAIKKLTNRIYPGGEYTKVSDLHMTIIANKRNPYGDDIVCYIFIFKNEKSAQEELIKINEHVGYNRDRAIVIEKKNLAVYLHVDSVKDFEHIRELSETIKKRLETL
jgi:hypothetical protein